MNTMWFQVIYGITSIYFGVLTLRILPTLLQLLAAMLAGAVKWPGPRTYDPDRSASILRERLGVGYQNLFPAFVGNAAGVIGGLVVSLLMFLSGTPLLKAHIVFKSMWGTLFLTLFAFAGAAIAFRKAAGNMIQVNTLLSNLATQEEPRSVEGRSAEAEYAIEHPLLGNQALKSATTIALDQFYESVRCHQDGNAARARSLYQQALDSDPSLHEHACETLSGMAQNCGVKDAGAICYWLAVHCEHLHDWAQAVNWYGKAIAAFNQIGYEKRESRAYCNRGSVKMLMGDPSALEDFEKAVVLNPMDGIAHINIGKAYYRISDPGDEGYERALDAFADATFADPDRYGPVVISVLRSIGYTWKEDLQKIEKRLAKKQGIDLDTLAAGEREDILQAYHYYEIGHGFFWSGRYEEALEQYEKGKLQSRNFPGNFLGVSMTAMQMIEAGAIPEGQIPFYLEKAEQNINECLRIAPTHLDYLDAKKTIIAYKKKYRFIPA